MMNYLRQIIRTLKLPLYALFGTIIANVFSGIAGNFLDDILRQILPYFILQITSIKFSLFTGFLTCLVFIFIIVDLTNKLNRLTINSKILEDLDKSLVLKTHEIITNASSLTDTENLNEVVIRYENYCFNQLNNNLKKLYNICQLTLFIPDPDQNEILVISNSIPQIDKQKISQLRLYYGDYLHNNRKLGLAGTALSKRNIEKVIFQKDSSGNSIPVGCSEYLVLPGNEQFQYTLSIAIPILIGKQQMGVICFDKRDNNDVDENEYELLSQIAQRVLYPLFLKKLLLR